MSNSEIKAIIRDIEYLILRTEYPNLFRVYYPNGSHYLQLGYNESESRWKLNEPEFIDATADELGKIIENR